WAGILGLLYNSLILQPLGFACLDYLIAGSFGFIVDQLLHASYSPELESHQERGKGKKALSNSSSAIHRIKPTQANSKSTMSTKSSTTILAFACCFLTLLSFAYSNNTDDKIYLSGLVYCDNCQLKSMTQISKMIPGAKVRLDCREGGNIKFSREGETNPLGLYWFELEKSKQPLNDCQVTLLHSPDPECKISHEVDRNNKSKTAPVATRKVNLLEGDSVVFIGPSQRVSYPLGLVVERARPEGEQFAKAHKHFQN
ncbi:unnamed protein product, partial [Prunus brigantina]